MVVTAKSLEIGPEASEEGKGFVRVDSLLVGLHWAYGQFYIGHPSWCLRVMQRALRKQPYGLARADSYLCTMALTYVKLWGRLAAVSSIVWSGNKAYIFKSFIKPAGSSLKNGFHSGAVCWQSAKHTSELFETHAATEVELSRTGCSVAFWGVDQSGIYNQKDATLRKSTSTIALFLGVAWNMLSRPATWIEYWWTRSTSSTSLDGWHVKKMKERQRVQCKVTRERAYTGVWCHLSD